MVIGVEDGDGDAVHVSGIGAGEVSGIEEVEGDRLAIGGAIGDHARLIFCCAVMSEHELVGASGSP